MSFNGLIIHHDGPYEDLNPVSRKRYGHIENPFLAFLYRFFVENPRQTVEWNRRKLLPYEKEYLIWSKKNPKATGAECDNKFLQLKNEYLIKQHGPPEPLQPNNDTQIANGIKTGIEVNREDPKEASSIETQSGPLISNPANVTEKNPVKLEVDWRSEMNNPDGTDKLIANAFIGI
ncbi:hypothetical protein HK098_004644 [Nowakowskiella sp. JEL0407]|nr:hypothetical protein HK098_004644 [Nowakowskiella sp. JEL0407]